MPRLDPGIHDLLARLKDVDGVAIRRIVILPDSIDREDFRQLRVSLRWK